MRVLEITLGPIINGVVVVGQTKRHSVNAAEVFGAAKSNINGILLIELVARIAQRPTNANRTIAGLLGQNHADLLPTPIVNELIDNVVVRIHLFYVCYCFFF